MHTKMNTEMNSFFGLIIKTISEFAVQKESLITTLAIIAILATLM